MQITLLLYLLFVMNARGEELIPSTIAAGYGFQNHTVTTRDGYILTIHRIPYSKREDNTAWKQKPVMLMMHGMMGTSASFITEGPNSNMAYIISDAGFDVWLGNARGNPYSRAHETLDPNKDSDKSAFFNFSWEEIAIFDLRAMVDYILGATAEQQLRFIGDTHGGTAFLILNYMKPEYNNKFVMAQLLDPCGYTKYFPSRQLKKAARMIDLLYDSALASEIVELSTMRKQTKLIMTPNFIAQSAVSYLASLGGFTTMGTSLKQIAHYAQNIRDKSFRSWSYGQDNNFKVYGSDYPPVYSLKNITVYTILYYRRNNMILGELDVRNMATDMPKAKFVGINSTKYTFSDLIEITRTAAP